jgi:hypothetical protein
MLFAPYSVLFALISGGNLPPDTPGNMSPGMFRAVVISGFQTANYQTKLSDCPDRLFLTSP